MVLLDSRRCRFIDVPETVLKGQEGLRGVPAEYAAFATAQIVCAIIAAVTTDRRFHSAYAVLWPIVLIGFLTLSNVTQIAD